MSNGKFNNMRAKVWSGDCEDGLLCNCSEKSLKINGFFRSTITGVKFSVVNDGGIFGEKDVMINLTFTLTDLPGYTEPIEISDQMQFSWEMNSRFVRTLEFLELLPTLISEFDAVSLLGTPVEVFVRSELMDEKFVNQIMDIQKRKDN
ncbi:hypothetical protein GH811_06610 [Acetobacterium malicum]|uniref:Preprotein translocase subunit SecB n=1 Tax=Acetobacterium malicum TaxID=52692 RepID=A0ABR6YVQ7_9FIRM|nr:hypothetical protein [Acetobacterium malicum]MBC3899282.1 hypothetical protein [Acetobacterium malicum]